MDNFSEKITELRQLKAIGLKAISNGFKMARAGIQTEDILNEVKYKLEDAEHLYKTEVRVAAGKKLDLEYIENTTIQEGDWVWNRVMVEKGDFAVRLTRLKLVDTPSPAHEAFLSHLQDAVDWMVETIRPNKKMTFYFTGSRGRSIVPKAFSLDKAAFGGQVIEPGQYFVLRPGSVLSVEPVVQSVEFGEVYINEIALLDDHGVVVI